jgi:hypothetical protein
MPALAQVAAETRRYDVFPRVRPTKVARHDMVNRKVPGSHAAVLAREVVTHEHLAARYTYRDPRAPYVVAQTDYPGARPRTAGGPDYHPP